MKSQARQRESVQLVQATIESELHQVGISLQKSQIDIDFKNCLITTDKVVPEETMSKICEYAAYKGITVKFQTSDQE